MCRHFAYVGAPVTIRELLLDPPHSLADQAWRPRRQRHGTMNVDGFGIGWYADGDPVPARYRRTGPIWADEALPDLARVTRTRAMLGAVRSASAGTDPASSAAAPYAAGRWLFSLNGALVGWPAAAAGAAGRQAGRCAAAQPAGLGLAAAQAAATAAGEPVTEPSPVPPAGGTDLAAAAVLDLVSGLAAADLLGLQSRCDSALIWTLVQARLESGAGAADALAGTVGDIAAAGGIGRFNLLLTDGTVIAATAAGDSLCWRQGRDGVVIASEPSDDDSGWNDIPDNSLVEATGAGVAVKPLATPPAPSGRQHGA